MRNIFGKIYYLLIIKKILHKSFNLVNTILPITYYVRTIGPTLFFHRELIRAHLLAASSAVTINLPALGHAFGNLRRLAP